MKKTEEIVSGKYGKSFYKLESDYQKQYDNNPTFRKLANSTKSTTEILMKYTSKIEEAACEWDNCSNCKNILECRNKVNGYRYTPNEIDGGIEFTYVPCKYKLKMDEDNKYLENTYYFDIPREIREASIKNINTSDKKRYPVIKWIKEFMEDNKNGIYHKGLYLNGNFGCGKTYLISAMLNELAKKGRSVAIVYYPEFIRSLKESFSDPDEYMKKYNSLKKADLVLFDDIGAEIVTEWSRDEVLGPILQYRMEEKLSTFFTSNLTIEELEELLANTKRDIDVVKARRIIERIKQLTDNITMISVNLRK